MSPLQSRELSIFNTAYQSTEEEALEEFNAECKNGVFDGVVIRRRPGHTTFCDTLSGASIQGLFYWVEKNLTIAVSNQNVYSIDSAGVATDITGDRPLGARTVSFTSDGTYFYAADGGKILYSDGASATQYISDADAPTAVSYLTYLDGYLFALEADTQNFYFSSPTDSLSWEALDFAKAEGDPDLLKAITIVDRQLLLLGAKSTEMYYNDGTTPWAANVSRYIQEGTIAEYSLAKVKEVPVWLSTRKEITTLSGNSEGISSEEITPFANRTLGDLTTVSDAIGMSITVRNAPMYLLYFPTEDKTLVFDLKHKKFFDWTTFDGEAGTHSAYLASCSAYHTQLGVQLVGSRTSSIIYKLDEDSFTDGSDDIRFVLKTGHITHGTSVKKNCARLRLKVKSGVETTAPELMIRYKNDNGLWNTERVVSMKAVGNNEFYADIHRLGQYRSRQWEISYADTGDLTIMKVEEFFEVLDS